MAQRIKELESERNAWFEAFEIPLTLIHREVIPQIMANTMKQFRDERDRLAGEVERLSSREVSCVWCGFKFDSTEQAQAEHLYQHALKCEKHPLKKAGDRIVELMDKTSQQATRIAVLELTISNLLSSVHNDCECYECKQAAKVLTERLET
jgi:hypothetical protein